MYQELDKFSLGKQHLTFSPVLLIAAEVNKWYVLPANYPTYGDGVRPIVAKLDWTSSIVS